MPATRPFSIRSLGVALGVALLYFLGGKLGLHFPYVGSSVTLIWPSSGIAFAAVWRFGSPAVAGTALGAFLVNLTIAGSFAYSLPVAVGNTLPALVACHMLRREGTIDLFRDPSTVSRFLAVAVLFAPMLSASAGTFTLWTHGGTSLTQLIYIWVVWWGGDAMGVLVVAPALLTLPQAPPLPRTPTAWAESGLMGSVFVVLFWGLFFFSAGPQVAPLSFGALPFLVWVALRFPLTVLCQILLVIAALAVYATAHGQGPFVRPSFRESFAFLHLFLMALASVGLMLGASVQAAHRSVRLANDHARRLAGQQAGVYSLIDEELLFQARATARITEK
jgi:integral membrane sensor domain MASE1